MKKTSKLHFWRCLQNFFRYSNILILYLGSCYNSLKLSVLVILYILVAFLMICPSLLNEIRKIVTDFAGKSIPNFTELG